MREKSRVEELGGGERESRGGEKREGREGEHRGVRRGREERWRVYETTHCVLHVLKLSLGGTCFIVLFLMQLLLTHEPFSTTDLLLATVHQCILSEDKLCIIRGEQSM